MNKIVLTIQIIALVIELLCLAYAIYLLIKINKLDKEIDEMFKEDKYEHIKRRSRELGEDI